MKRLLRREGDIAIDCTGWLKMRSRPTTSMNTIAYLMMTNVPPSAWLGAICSPLQIVGRSHDNDVIVPARHLAVSRRHLQIRVSRELIFIQDLNSSGGTRLNGVLLVPDRETEVVFGDRISLAGLEVILVSPDAEILRQPSTTVDVGVEPESSIILVGAGAESSREARQLRQLSPAELQVVFWVSRGLTTFEEIGAKLFRSPHTIRTQINHIYRKLHVHSREELLAWLTRNELSWAYTPKIASDSIHGDDSDYFDFSAEEPVVMDS